MEDTTVETVTVKIIINGTTAYCEFPLEGISNDLVETKMRSTFSVTRGTLSSCIERPVFVDRFVAGTVYYFINFSSPRGATAVNASAESAKINFEAVIDASLILLIEMEVEIKVRKKKTKTTKSFSLSGVAVSNKLCLTALHGNFPVGTQVRVTTRNGKILFGHVEFERFEENMVDIAVIVLNDEFEFTHFIEWTNNRVQLLQPIVVVGLKYGSIGDAVFPYARLTAVEMIEQFGDASALFHANYYNFDGCSGAGVVTKVVNNTPILVGVHVASHEDSTVGVKRKRNSCFANFEAEVKSDIHGHKAYSLVCEIARVPDLIHFLTSHV